MEPKKYLFDWSFSLENYDDADEFVIEEMLEIIIDEIYDELKKKKARFDGASGTLEHEEDDGSDDAYQSSKDDK